MHHEGYGYLQNTSSQRQASAQTQHGIVLSYVVSDEGGEFCQGKTAPAPAQNSLVTWLLSTSKIHVQRNPSLCRLGYSNDIIGTVMYLAS